MLELSDKEKSDLHALLGDPLLKRVFEEGLRKVWAKKRNMETLEGAAMAYNHQSGASDLLDEIYSLAELKGSFYVPMRKLRH